MEGGALYLLSFLFSVQVGFAQSLSIGAVLAIDDPEYGSFYVEGFSTGEFNQLLERELASADFTEIFNVKVSGAKLNVSGSHRVENDRIIFTPRFVPDPTITYQVTFSSEAFKNQVGSLGQSEDLIEEIQFKEPSVVPSVVNVYPNVPELPANVLRFYVEFSAPMNLKNPFEYIGILNENGEKIKEPFVELEKGLWSPDRTRLTLLIHPGRIKRGVGPNLTIGEVFEEGNSYQLAIDESWGLTEPYVMKFKVAGPVRSTIDLNRWMIEVPRVDSMDALQITTASILDKALAERLIQIQRNEIKLVGDWTYDPSTKLLNFSPSEAWKDVTYSVFVSPKLEDVSGNTPINVFDLEGGGKIKGEVEPTVLSFSPKN